MLVGSGTAGAYHAGVLRALREAGVRIDLVAGRGMGAASALFAAIDADTQLWEEQGLWTSAAPPIYGWRWPWQTVVAGLGAACAAMLLPLVFLLLAALLYPIVFLMQLVLPSRAAWVVDHYAGMVAWSLSPEFLASFVPRAAAVAVLVSVGALAVAAALSMWNRPTRRRARGRWWWRAFGAPMSGGAATDWVLRGFWRFLRGAAQVAQPAPDDLSRRYADLLSEGIGQPGYRDLLIAVHDIDARRDLVFALLGDVRRQGFFADVAAAGRAAETIDLAGVGRAHVVDALAGALAVPVVTEPHAITFAVDGPWRGETHRLSDRDGAIARLLEEVVRAGVEQVVVVSAAAPLEGPHALSAPRLDPRARFGETLAAGDAATVRDAMASFAASFTATFEVRPMHNPLGPFDFEGTYDERSDRRQSLRELVARGYEDAYRQFIEPVVGASGEELRGADLQRS